MAQPPYRRSRFGMKFVSLKDGRTLYEHAPDQLFATGSVGKLFPTGTALATMGPDFRFRTRVYRAGPVADGVLKGDLVLVASGDPNLSGRIQADGTLVYGEWDHSLDMIAGAAVVGGDPLQVIRRLASQVAAKGIRKIEGVVRVDVSLFPETPWAAEPQTVISPISVNDNIVDLFFDPGAEVGDPATVRTSPETAYVRVVNRTTTVADGPATVALIDHVRGPDGTHAVTAVGNVPMTEKAVLRAYWVPEPQRFAETVLAEALRDEGVEARTDLNSRADFKVLSAAYTANSEVAEHISPPLTEAVKVVQKLSQNLHAAMIPYLIGAYVGNDNASSNRTGFAVQKELFEKAGVELDAAIQSDASGYNSRYSPAATVRFLEYMAEQPFFRAFLDAQPILGRDGTLASSLKTASAAGHVHAKTGTEVIDDFVSGGMVVTGKGLGGYIDGPGEMVAFGLYANNVLVDDLDGTSAVGHTLGEIVTAVYDSLVQPQ